MSGRIRVEVESAAAASDLVQGLVGMRPHVVLHDGRYGVEVHGAQASSRLVVGVLAAVEKWLMRSQMPSATVHLGDRAYTLTSPALS